MVNISVHFLDVLNIFAFERVDTFADKNVKLSVLCIKLVRLRKPIRDNCKIFVKSKQKKIGNHNFF